MACGSLAASYRNKVGLVLAFELWPRTRSRTFIERWETFFNKSFAGAFDRGLARVESRRDLCISQAFGGLQQDARPRDFAGRRLTFSDELEKCFLLLSG